VTHIDDELQHAVDEATAAINGAVDATYRYDVYVRVGGLPERRIGSVARGATPADLIHSLAELLHEAGHQLVVSLAADTNEPDCT
jgi:hypothetical protein